MLAFRRKEKKGKDMDYEGILKFRGTWRSYQDRVLRNAEHYMEDGRVHIVAAPGSGKTTLGIELIRRQKEKALVLVPTVTIREQWIARIREAFLCEGVEEEVYLSQNLREPKEITVATYQALHSAMTRFRGREETESEKEEPVEAGQEVDYSGFDLTAVMKETGIGVLCLDECHHLRNEWWKALEEFRREMKGLRVIALTATPPYDSTPAMWTKYIDMCGEIDEEITIPELVKEGSLCPHQDYVYFNYPTSEEEKEWKKFQERSKAMLQTLMEDGELLNAVRGHKGLIGQMEEELLLSDPAYLSSILIYLQSKGVPFPERLQRLLGAKRLPKMDVGWMERLLQGFLYHDTESYLCDKMYREMLEDRLKRQGLLEKKKVILTTSAAVEKLLTNSLGKINSIRKIVFHEYETMGEELRLLVLTDYIRRECEGILGDSGSDVNLLGVLPFFEMLRRESAKRQASLRLGVLCGSIVIIPAEAKEALLQEIGEADRVAFGRAGSLSEAEYLKVTAVGEGHFLTAAVTAIFSKGYIQTLIGTKSLLGEGWDSPCVNALILASFVGSFMLSNQMRGRAIRVWKDNPDKTSNIWHLVCLKPQKEARKDSEEEISEDFRLLDRRMEQFLGLHDREETIESGIQRLSVIKPPFHKPQVQSINKRMLEMSSQRSCLKQRWEKALVIYEAMEVAVETEVKETFVTKVAFFDALLNLVLAIGLTMAATVLLLLPVNPVLTFAGYFLVVIGGGWAMTRFPKVFMLGSPLRRLKAFGEGIRRAMEEQQLLAETRCKVETETFSTEVHTLYLSGGTGRDKALFAQCVHEFFTALDNQRYILVKKEKRRGIDSFYAVPECFARKKEMAEAFAKCMKPYIGSYDCVYTRNEAGRKLLLEGRVKALANREERCLSRKKVKGALE